MANLAVIGSSSVNGVNHRRFLLVANPTLSRLLTVSIGSDWIKDAKELRKLRAYEQDASFLEKLAEVKYQNNAHLLKWVQEKQDVILDPASVFDVHVKRLHAYKRQLLNVLKIMYLDGANVEIKEAVGEKNMFVFGLTAEEVIDFGRQRNYRSWDVYHSNPALRQCVDQLINGFFNEDASEEFRIIYDSLLLYNDEFFVLKDFASYIEAFNNLTEAYHERPTWQRMALVNIAKSSRFSSDRAITEYAQEIWKVNPGK